MVTASEVARLLRVVRRTLLLLNIASAYMNTYFSLATAVHSSCVVQKIGHQANTREAPRRRSTFLEPGRGCCATFRVDRVGYKQNSSISVMPACTYETCDLYHGCTVNNAEFLRASAAQLAKNTGFGLPPISSLYGVDTLSSKKPGLLPFAIKQTQNGRPGNSKDRPTNKIYI